MRRQFGHDSRTGLEQPVLDYKAQQYRVLSMLATVFALHFTGQWMRSAFNQLNTEFAQGKFDFLPAIHAASSGLKGTVTNITATGIEQLRLSLGGHGYSAVCYIFAKICHILFSNIRYKTVQWNASFLHHVHPYANC